MDPFLAMLFGQQSATTPGINPDANEQFGVPETVGNDLFVQGYTPQAPTPDRPPLDIPDRPQATGRYVLNDDRVPPTEDDLSEVVPRKGMFGIKGTLRDVLGTLGDAFLVQGGADRIYGPRRDQERVGDAMLGATQSPEAAAQAVERLAGMGYAAEAKTLMEQMQSQQLRQAQQASLDANRQSLITGRNDERLDNFRKYASQALASAGDNPQSQQYALQLLAQQAQRLGISLEDLGITEDMTPEQMRLVADAGMPVQNIRNLPLAERRTATGEYNAQTGRINATRPRQNRSISRQEQFENFRSIPREDRTKEEQDFIDEYTGQNRGRGRGTRSVPSTDGLKIRPVKQ